MAVFVAVLDCFLATTYPDFSNGRDWTIGVTFEMNAGSLKSDTVTF